MIAASPEPVVAASEPLHASRWIAPDQNRTADPLPAMGAWIAPPADAGTGALVGRLHLPAGYPRCFGFAWIAAAPGCSVTLNGHKLEPAGPLDAERPTFVGLPWNHLRQGDNELRVSGPADALAAGASALIRVREAHTGYHDAVTDAQWRFVADGSTDAVPARVLDGRAPCPAAPDNGPRRAVDLRRAFAVDAPIARATLRVTGLGAYEVALNGKKVGGELLAPGWTDFATRMHVATHDVTPMLAAGENAIVATLGNGWWSSGMGWESRGIHARPGEPLCLLLELTIETTTGRTITIASDDAWTWRVSHITHDTIYHGQRTDLRRDAVTEPWRPVALLERSPTSRLEPMPAEPIEVIETLDATEIRRLADGAWLLDFGQNHAGRPHVRGTFPAGTTITIRCCEVLDERGEPYFENYRTAGTTDVIVCGDDPVDHAPAFTYRGYRYLVVSGWPDGFEPDAQTVRSEVLHNAVALASEFETSNPLLNDIDRIVRWGLRSNLHSVPTDCPQRDERLGWTGDVQLFAATSCWLMDLRRFYGKWLTDLTDAQRPDGRVTHIAPYLPQILDDSAAPIWADVIAILPQVLHQFYGDVDVVRRTYGATKRWVEWFATKADRGLALVGGFGDWVSLEATPPELCGAAYYAHTCRVAANLARTLGEGDDARRFDRLADDAAKAFHRHFFCPEAGRYAPDTQTAQILPLAFDLTPPALRQGVADHLASLVQARGAKPATGFAGTALLLPVLSRFGHHELAYDVINTREFPSLGYMVDQGATTVWERWNSDKEGPDMNSRNHFCLGAMAQWMYEDLAGVRPDPAAPGFANVLIAPRPAGDVRDLRFDYRTPHGRVRVAWEVRDEAIALDVELPAGVTATLRLPTDRPTAARFDDPSRAAAVGGVGAAHEWRLRPGAHRVVAPLAGAAVPSSAGTR